MGRPRCLRPQLRRDSLGSAKHAMRLAGVTLAMLFGGSGLRAQLPIFPNDSAAHAWVREAPQRAQAMAGCYRLAKAIRDSVDVPSSFRLTSERVTALGYHRPAHFWTDLPQASGGETRPIWTPRRDSVIVDLVPQSTGMPRFELVFRMRGDSLAGQFQETKWVADTSTMGLSGTQVRVRPITGRRLSCGPALPN